MRPFSARPPTTYEVYSASLVWNNVALARLAWPIRGVWVASTT